MTENENLLWKVNTPGLLKEILSNPGISILKIPIQIFAKILALVAERAAELDDPKLNALMCRLALYEQSDPYSKDYDEELINKIIYNDRKESIPDNGGPG